MTYCVALNINEGLVLASDTRTNAGVDHIATFSKMSVIEAPGRAVIMLMSAGNLATTQSVISLLQQRVADDGFPSILQLPSMYDAAVMVGELMREVMIRDAGQLVTGVDFSSSFLLCGQIQNEPTRLFNIYPQGNFIETTPDTTYFQIGEAKYGKPILDRVIEYNTPMSEAAKCVLVSFDSTIRSNLSVGLPIDVILYRAGTLQVTNRQRITEDDPYYQMIRQGWSQGLKDTFTTLADPEWAST